VGKAGDFISNVFGCIQDVRDATTVCHRQEGQYIDGKSTAQRVPWSNPDFLHGSAAKRRDTGAGGWMDSEVADCGSWIVVRDGLCYLSDDLRSRRSFEILSSTGDFS